MTCASPQVRAFEPSSWASTPNGESDASLFSDYLLDNLALDPQEYATIGDQDNSQSLDLFPDFQSNLDPMLDAGFTNDDQSTEPTVVESTPSEDRLFAELLTDFNNDHTPNVQHAPTAKDTSTAHDPLFDLFDEFVNDNTNASEFNRDTSMDDAAIRQDSFEIDGADNTSSFFENIFLPEYPLSDFQFEGLDDIDTTADITFTPGYGSTNFNIPPPSQPTPTPTCLPPSFFQNPPTSTAAYPLSSSPFNFNPPPTPPNYTYPSPSYNIPLNTPYPPFLVPGSYTNHQANQFTQMTPPSQLPSSLPYSHHQPHNYSTPIPQTPFSAFSSNSSSSSNLSSPPPSPPPSTRYHTRYSTTAPTKPKRAYRKPSLADRMRGARGARKGGIQGRRVKNPGRKITIEQTPAVMKRNANRRARYRATLDEERRAVYDATAPGDW